MKYLLLALVLSFLISQKAFAFQDACSVESQIVSSLNSLYAEELSKVMAEAKLLDPQIESLEMRIKEIEAKILLELAWISPERIRLEQYDRTKDLHAQLDTLLWKQAIIMKKADIYKVWANNATSKLYICRYNTLQILLEQLNKYWLTNDDKVSILEQAFYYSDSEEQKQVIKKYLVQYKSNWTWVIIQKKSKEKLLTLQEKRAIKLNEMKEKRLTQLKTLKKARVTKTKTLN